MKNLKNISVLTSVICLSACVKSASFDSYADEYVGIITEALDGGYEITAVGAIPSSSNATYEGVILFDAVGVSVNESYAGNLTLTANFDTNSTSGSASDFVDSADEAVTGTLVGTGGVIDRTADPADEWQIVMDLDGVLIDIGAVALTIDAQIDADFIGPSAQLISGIVTGDISSSYGPETIDGVVAAKN